MGLEECRRINGLQQALPVAQRCLQGLFLFLLPSAVLAPGLEHSCRSHPTPRSRCCAAAARPLPLCCRPFMVSWRFVASHPIATRFLNVFLSLQASRSSFTFGKITSHFLLSSLSPLSLPPSETEEPASSFPPKTLHAGHLPCHPPLCPHSPLVEAVILSPDRGSRGRRSSWPAPPQPLQPGSLCASLPERTSC